MMEVRKQEGRRSDRKEEESKGGEIREERRENMSTKN